MFNSYKVIYEIYEKKDSVPFTRIYAFSCTGGKRNAMRIANDILIDYILDMHFYVGSIKTIKEIN